MGRSLELVGDGFHLQMHSTIASRQKKRNSQKQINSTLRLNPKASAFLVKQLILDFALMAVFQKTSIAIAAFAHHAAPEFGDVSEFAQHQVEVSGLTLRKTREKHARGIFWAPRVTTEKRPHTVFPTGSDQCPRCRSTVGEVYQCFGCKQFCCAQCILRLGRKGCAKPPQEAPSKDWAPCVSDKLPSAGDSTSGKDQENGLSETFQNPLGPDNNNAG